ncbi:MAG: ATP-dependent RecD-like DNA helicase [Gammaproteobacteria bacterium]|nr:ATP-dependent RecD-like DNA helicase [Gammaproteobacteria bacterium]
MVSVQVEWIIAEKDWGTLFYGRCLDSGDRFAVATQRAHTLTPPLPGELWEVDGIFRKTSYGRQLQTTSAKRRLPTGELIIKFLANHCVGVGEQRARNLWEKWGEKLDESIRTLDITEIGNVLAPDKPRLGPVLASQVKDTWMQEVAETKLAEWLMKHNIYDLRILRRLARILGIDASDRLEENVWSLVPIMGWAKVDSIGIEVLISSGLPRPDARRDERRLVGAVDAVLKEGINAGHTLFSMEELRIGVANHLGVNPSSQRVTEAIAASVRQCRLVLDSVGIRPPGCKVMEDQVEERLTKMTSQGSQLIEQSVSVLLDSYVSDRLTLHPEQYKAVIKSLTNPVACLSGGAGVGKTTVLRVIADLWEQMGGKVILCAFTGKAALRMNQSTGRFAQTISRLLKSIEHNENSSKEAIVFDDISLVVVDEASMLDLPMLWRLLNSMPVSARILFVGDHKQLPPIGFGLTFHRLVKFDSITAQLTTVHRQSGESGIPIFANAIRNGEVPSLNQYGQDTNDVSILSAQNSEKLTDLTERVARDLGGFENGRLVVITPINKGDSGVSVLNSHFHEIYLQNNTSLVDVRGSLGNRFSPGEPVIHLRNNYAKETGAQIETKTAEGNVERVPERVTLVNGQQGKIVMVDPNSRSVDVEFDGKKIRFLSDELIDLQLAYAMTAHKAQGSEVDNVIVILHDSQFVEPSWLYTAITRARKRVVLIGEVSVFQKCLSRPWASDVRRIGLYEKVLAQ